MFFLASFHWIAHSTTRSKLPRSSEVDKTIQVVVVRYSDAAQTKRGF